MRRAPINPLANCLITAIPAWRNLVAMTINPMQAPQDLFVEPLRLLRNSPDLRTLEVNAACTGSASALVLSEIVGLGSLTLIDPNREILNLLPDWLSRLSGTLCKLHLLVSLSICQRIYLGDHLAGRTTVVPSPLGSYKPSSRWQCGYNRSPWVFRTRSKMAMSSSSFPTSLGSKISNSGTTG